MENAIMVVAAIACVCFFHWMRHQRRILIHRERMAAVEKGVTFPPSNRRSGATPGMSNASSCSPA